MYIGNLSLCLSFFPYYWIFFKRTVFLTRIFWIWMLFVGLGPVGLAWACSQSEKNQCHIHCTWPKGQKCHSFLTLFEYKSMCKDSLHDSLHSSRGILMNSLIIKLSNGNWLLIVPVFESLSRWQQHNGVKAAIKKRLFMMHNCGFKGKVMNVKSLTLQAFTELMWTCSNKESLMVHSDIHYKLLHFTKSCSSTNYACAADNKEPVLRQ